MISVTRRSFAALPVLGALPASATEWLQPYDTGSRVDAIRYNETPLFSPAVIAATEKAVADMQAIAARGGWPVMPKINLSLGMQGEAVGLLRQRLAAEGELSPADVNSGAYDTFVENAVRRIQARHGLTPSGKVTAATIEDMNIPAATRVRQLQVNLVRLRSLAGATAGRSVVVNIPGAQVEAVENGRVATRHVAGVGKSDRQSPLLTSKIVEINFNPFWTVPASIIRKDLIPKMRVEPNYLTENKIRILAKNGQEISPASVNWNSDEATRYTFRQDPGGEFNSLGYSRINFPNPHGVYMHDTPLKGIFGDDSRFVSSGCVRLQNVRDFLVWLLRDNGGWDRMRVEEEFQGGKRTDVRLASPVPLVWTYITAWATPDGAVQFRDDIYGRDGVS